MGAPEKIQALIQADGGWQDAGGISRRGICDYQRQITFTRMLEDHEITSVRNWLAEDKCPGWTGVSYRYIGAERATYRFTTTMDSSD